MPRIDFLEQMAEIIYYDVFISHAYEDKHIFTNELAIALKEEGLKVWYSGFELKLGDSIAESVNNALKGAQYGIVVISPIYLEKQWAMCELKALFTQEAERNRILPILHNITIEEIKEQLPMLADRYAVSSEKGLDYIIDKVMEVIMGKQRVSEKVSWNSRIYGSPKSRWKNYLSDNGSITLGGTMHMYQTSTSTPFPIYSKRKRDHKKRFDWKTIFRNKIVLCFIFLASLLAVIIGARSCHSPTLLETPSVNKDFGKRANSQ